MVCLIMLDVFILTYSREKREKKTILGQMLLKVQEYINRLHKVCFFLGRAFEYLLCP